MKIILKNFLFLGSGEIISKLFGFFTTIYLARVLGVEGYGKLGFVLAVYSYFDLIANLGFEAVGTREVASGKSSVSETVSSIFFLRLFLSLSSFIILFLSSFFFQIDEDVRQLLLLQGLNLLLLPLSLYYFFSGKEKMHYVAISKIAQSFIYFLLINFFVSSSHQLWLSPLFFIISTITSYIFLFFSKSLQTFSLTFPSQKVVKQILYSSFIMGLSTMMIRIYWNMDTVMVGILRTSFEVGLYTSAYKIVILLTTLPNIIITAFFPSFSKYTISKDGVSLLIKYILVLIILGLPIGFIGYFIAETVIHILFGSNYQEAVVPMQILFFNVSFIFLNIALANPLIAWGKQREYLIIVSSGALVNVILNFLLIPNFGIVGAAIATVCSEVAVFFQSWYYLTKFIDIDLWKYLQLPLVITVLVFLLCFGIKKVFHVNNVVMSILYCTFFLSALFYYRNTFLQYVKNSPQLKFNV